MNFPDEGGRSRIPPADANFLILATDTKKQIAGVVRHEAGHAVMAWHLGCYVRWIVYGIDSLGAPHGVTNHLLPRDAHGRIMILLSGTLALYLHDVASTPTKETFLTWASSNYDEAVSGAGDWIEVLKLADKPLGQGWDYHLTHAVLPYFAEAVTALASRRAQIDDLTQFLLDRPGGAGPRALRRFAAGLSPSPWADWRDRRRVKLALADSRKHSLL
jgi:hypothetical protein